MEFNLVTNVESCYLAILDNPDLLYYSHIPTALISLLLGFFVLFKNRGDLSARLLFGVTISFALWCASDLMLWLDKDSRGIMFFWSLINFFENLVSGFTFYFTYTFLEKKDIMFRFKLLGFFLFIPFLLLLPTSYNVTSFNDALCEAGQGMLTNYFYLLECIFFFGLVIYALQKIWRTHGDQKLQAILLTAGSILFILSFSGANIAGSIASSVNPDNPDNWKILQYGLFGMPVFLSFLTYLIVKYRAFEMRVVAAQALVIGLLSLIGSEIFFVRDITNYVIVGLTFTLTGIFGIILVRSVQGEVRRKEELQIITNRLAEANAELRRLDTAKSEFISIASHQLRTPLTAIKGFVSLLLEGAYGKLEPSIADTLNKVYLANARLMNLVENLLNISRIESGRIQYQFAPAKIESILDELNDIFGVAAHEKGVVLNFKKGKKPLPMAMIDAAKVREVISNLIDNALKYTESGTVTIETVEERDGIQITISDTGVGIEPDDLPRLFHKFERGRNSAQVNVSSTGLGLYVSKRFVEAHGGTIIGESQGHGKGSKFTVWLPFQPVKKT